MREYEELDKVADIPDSPNDDDGADVPLPDHEKVRIAITRLKNNIAAGADGLQAELFKHGGEERVRSLHQLLCKVRTKACPKIGI